MFLYCSIQSLIQKIYFFRTTIAGDNSWDNHNHGGGHGWNDFGLDNFRGGNGGNWKNDNFGGGYQQNYGGGPIRNSGGAGGYMGGDRGKRGPYAREFARKFPSSLPDR